MKVDKPERCWDPSSSDCLVLLRAAPEHYYFIDKIIVCYKEQLKRCHKKYKETADIARWSFRHSSPLWTLLLLNLAYLTYMHRQNLSFSPQAKRHKLSLLFTSQWLTQITLVTLSAASTWRENTTTGYRIPPPLFGQCFWFACAFCWMASLHRIISWRTSLNIILSYTLWNNFVAKVFLWRAAQNLQNKFAVLKNNEIQGFKMTPRCYSSLKSSPLNMLCCY